MKVVNINNLPAQEAILKEGIEIALADDLSDACKSTESIRCEGFGIVYVISGHASCSIGEQHYEVGARDLIFLSDGMVVKNIMISLALEVRVFFLSPQFVDSLANKLRISWNVRNMALTQEAPPLIHITEEEGRNICLYYELLNSKREETRHQEQSIGSLCEAFGYEMLDLVHRYVLAEREETETIRIGTSASDIHFDRFVRLLQETHPIPRQVSWYADRLSITPKYLTVLCQRVTRKTPSALIEQELVQQATTLLREGLLSIKEISQQLGFNNQSHFGTYLRRSTGRGPQEIREA